MKLQIRYGNNNVTCIKSNNSGYYYSTARPFLDIEFLFWIFMVQKRKDGKEWTRDENPSTDQWYMNDRKNFESKPYFPSVSLLDFGEGEDEIVWTFIFQLGLSLRRIISTILFYFSFLSFFSLLCRSFPTSPSLNLISVDVDHPN